MGFWRDIAESLGIVRELTDFEKMKRRPQHEQRSCYHTKHKADCPFYQMGKCDCL
jgi:hypothetical protein